MPSTSSLEASKATRVSATLRKTAPDSEHKCTVSRNVLYLWAPIVASHGILCEGGRCDDWERSVEVRGQSP